MIEIKNNDIVVTIKGKGSPTVVFESGLGDCKDTWSKDKQSICLR